MKSAAGLRAWNKQLWIAIPLAAAVILSPQAFATDPPPSESAQLPSPDAEPSATGEWSGTWSAPAMSLADAYRLTGGAFVLQLDPMTAPFVLTRAPGSSDCDQQSPYDTSLDVFQAADQAIRRLYFPGTALTYVEIARTFGAATQEESRDIQLNLDMQQAETGQSGSSNALNDAIGSVARTRKVGNLHYIELGGTQEHPSIIFNGGRDEGSGAFSGGAEIPGVLIADGDLTFSDGLRVDHRLRIVAYEMPLQNGGRLLLLPGQGAHFSIDPIGRAAGSTSPEMGIAVELPVTHFVNPLRIELTAGPDFIVRPGQDDSFTVLPTAMGRVSWSVW